MGVWGAGLYDDDDVAADVRGEYRDLVGDGVPGPEATDTLLARWADALDDPDDASPFWLALADTQWRVGRLEDRVGDQAKSIISTGRDQAHFERDPRMLARRRRVLADLAERLDSPQRSPVRLRPRFRSVSPVGVGDVFSYDLGDGPIVFFRVVEVIGDERDHYPSVELLDWSGPGAPPDPATLGARPAKPGRPDLLWVTRRRRDPDPAERIAVHAPGTRVTRRKLLPALMVSWPELGETLARNFGI